MDSGENGVPGGSPKGNASANGAGDESWVLEDFDEEPGALKNAVPSSIANFRDELRKAAASLEPELFAISSSRKKSDSLCEMSPMRRPSSISGTALRTGAGRRASDISKLSSGEALREGLPEGSPVDFYFSEEIGKWREKNDMQDSAGTLMNSWEAVPSSATLPRVPRVEWDPAIEPVSHKSGASSAFSRSIDIFSPPDPKLVVEPVVAVLPPEVTLEDSVPALNDVFIAADPILSSLEVSCLPSSVHLSTPTPLSEMEDVINDVNKTTLAVTNCSATRTTTTTAASMASPYLSLTSATRHTKAMYTELPPPGLAQCTTVLVPDSGGTKFTVAVFGGLTSSTGTDHELNPSVFELHCGSGVSFSQWESVRPGVHPYPRYGHSAVVWEDCIVVFGGYGVNGLDPELGVLPRRVHGKGRRSGTSTRKATADFGSPRQSHSAASADSRPQSDFHPP
eukprot:RCo037827